MRLPRLALLLTIAVMGAGSALAQSRDISVDEMRGEKRVALVIGNSAYATSPLRNPVNDARAMAATLRRLGFDVLAHENLGEKAMRRAINEFGDRLARGGIGLFFFAGHGIQVGGKNLIVPVDAAIRTERDVEIEAVDVGRVLARMDEARNRLNIVVLDACRDNPFGRSFRSATRGLASIDAPSGTLIAYATAPGKVARDGDGTHGLYTGELLKAIQVGGLRVEDVFKRVRREVQRETRGEQVPWESSSLVGDFMFALPGSHVAAVRPSPAPPPEPTITKEVVREVGSLAIRGKLPGIEVWLDEQKIGETEQGTVLVMSNLPIGTYRLKGSKAGHRDWTRQVQVAANQRAEIVIEIEPLRTQPPRTVRADDGAEMLLVPAGEFLMGGQDAATARAAQLPAFYIDKYEVTNALFKKFATATGRESDDRTGPNHPVTRIDWSGADAYCKWAGKRLPTNAEWEKAARGTDGRIYPWGNQWDPARANWKEAGTKGPVPVGSYPGGISSYGVHDMAGNVEEWVADSDTAGRKVQRGGSYNDSAQRVRTVSAYHFAPTDRDSMTGFRCAKDATP